MHIGVYEVSVVGGSLALDAVEEFLVSELLLLVVDHGELVGLELVLLELGGFGDEIGELNDVAALGIGLEGIAADVSQFVNGLVVDLREELFGTQGLIANLLDAFEVLREVSFELGEVVLDLLD